MEFLYPDAGNILRRLHYDNIRAGLFNIVAAEIAEVRRGLEYAGILWFSRRGEGASGPMLSHTIPLRSDPLLFTLVTNLGPHMMFT